MINMGVIGTGTWGRNHVRVWHELPDVKLAAIADQNKAALDALTRTFSVRGETDYMKLLQDPGIDAVSICTPSSTHYALAAEALRAGKHVLLEKPIALAAAEGQRLLQLAAEKKKILMVGHVFRFDPTIIRIKQEIQKGTVGNVNFLYSSRLGLMTPRPDCGVILDFALHDIDIACYLLDRFPTQVTAVGRTYRTQNYRTFEDVGFITMEFPDGILADVAVSWLTPKKIRDLWVIGSERSIGADLMTQRCVVYDKGIVPHYGSFGEFKLITKSGEDSTLAIEAKEPLKEELAHFASCIRQGTLPSVPGEVAVKVVQVIEACYQSMKTQKTVVVDYDT